MGVHAPSFCHITIEASISGFSPLSLTVSVASRPRSPVVSILLSPRKPKASLQPKVETYLLRLSA